MYKNNKTQLASLPEDGHNTLPIYGQYLDIGKLILTGKERLAESNTSATEAGLHTEPQ